MAAVALTAALPFPAAAQTTGDMPPPVPADISNGLDREVYVPADFARFAPRNALDMLSRVPGFTIVSEDQGRGLGQASANVLINGERVASKSEGVFDVLRRINADRVERIEIVDGATLGIPGLAGQVANIVARGGEIGGRFEYRATARPRYASPSYGGGEISLSGSTSRLEWSAAYSHGTGRGGAGGRASGIVTDGDGNLLETREVLVRFVGEFPRLSGRVKWEGPGGLVANFNANYSHSYTGLTNDEDRDLVAGVDLFRDFHNRGRGRGHEIGGDADFALGPGRLKLIGLERFNHNTGRSDSIMIYSDGAPSTGSRFTSHADSGERIGRAEYRWDMLDGQWQLDAEAAFNRLDQTAQLFVLDPAGDFGEVPFPAGSGGVTEDRYETILNHSRTLGSGFSLQVGAGAEYSKLAQIGPGGLRRTFWRPKGSATLSWVARPGLDLSLKLARTVGQLSFGDFLASVNLAQETGNAGNAQLVPQQAWEADFEVKKNLQAWGSATLRFYGRWIGDYIDIVPVGGGLESRGNIVGGATLYGASLNATVNLDLLGWQGARINASGRIEDSSLADPLTAASRPFSSHNYTGGDLSLRYDMPASDWAFGAGFNWNLNKHYVRLSEVGREYEGPVYTYAFVEHKDVLGLTVNFQVFNLTDGRAFFDRTVYSGPRHTAPILFVERRNMSVQPIFQLRVTGSF